MNILAGYLNFIRLRYQPRFLDISFCLDFCYESDGLFVLGVGFFLHTNFDFLTSHFERILLRPFKMCRCPDLLKVYLTCDRFSQSYEGLNIAILVNLGQLTSDIFRAINA